MSTNIFAQTQTSSNQSLDNPAFYSATDSIVADIPNQIVRLYGQANVTYDDVVLDAEIIEIDLKNNEVFAHYGIDSIGEPFGKPVFKQGGEEVRCDKIKYNFNTKKGYITEVRTQQGEGYIHMAESKIHPNEEIHLKNGKYTSCDAEKPHYHFQLSKAIVVPEKRIVTGPLYMRILNVPLPVAAPFAILPNSESRKHGLIIPEFAIGSIYGSGLKDLGYYFPINDHLETYMYLTGYTTGRWGISNQTNYYKKYKYRGNLILKFERLKGYFYDLETDANNYTVNWRHNQDAKAHPSLKFNSDINFISNNPKKSFEIIGEEYFNTQLNSSMNLTKAWKMSKFNGSWTLKTSLRQNKQAKKYNLELPSFNFNVSRFDLGVLRQSKIGKKWYENITVTYNLNSANSINAPDSIFNKTYSNLISDYTLNGIKQNAVLQTNLKPKSGWFTFNLTSNYSELWNFQSYEKNWDTFNNKVDTSFINGLKTTRNVNFSGGLSTNLYGYYKSPKQNAKLRHVMSPNISFTYKPDLGAHQFYLDSLNQTVYYSPFDVSLYKEVRRGQSGVINFNLTNTLELKTRSRKDSLNDTYKQKRLIDAFTIGGNYDIFKDSFLLSDFTFSFRTTPIKNISLQAGWRVTPYDWDDNTGEITDTYAWTVGKGIGRVNSANTAITARFKSSTKKDSSRFNIPWKINLTYNIKYIRNQTGNIQKDTFNLIQYIDIKGQLKFNDKWRFDYGINYDIQNFNTISPMAGVNNFNYLLWRDLHCWEVALEWNQIGGGKWTRNAVTNDLTWKRPTSYVLGFRINIKASMFSSFLPEQKLRARDEWWQ